ncbi:MAG: 3-hydroxyacyl-CoA dehydrogenase family protein [Chitinophagaceae bacterium]
MKIVVITNDALKAELLEQGLQDDVQVEWYHEIVPVAGANAYIDLLFTQSEERINKLTALQPSAIIINSVEVTLSELPAGFIRLNGWNSFLKRPVVEMAGTGKNKIIAEKVFSCFNKTTEWVADVPGLITARVISTIINEAYFTLAEKVSTKEEIDTAMKLGTNYPYGPFEWAEKIGLKNVYGLLQLLSKQNSRYTPSSLLQKEAQAS